MGHLDKLAINKRECAYIDTLASDGHIYHKANVYKDLEMQFSREMITGAEDFNNALTSIESMKSDIAKLMHDFLVAHHTHASKIYESIPH